MGETGAFLSRDLHHLELERRAVRALENQDPRLAFRMADRRCRIPPLPSSQVYLLRAESLHRLGHTDEALKDVAKALELTPDDIAATRRMMSWGAGDRQIEAATAVVAYDHDPGYLNAAIKLLRVAGHDAFARIQPFDDEVVGWVTWSTAGIIEVRLASESETKTLILSPDRSHPLAGRSAYAANYKIKRPRSIEQSLHITKDEQIIAIRQLPRNVPFGRRGLVKQRPAHSQASNTSPPLVTIIVPVYADFDATEACLNSVVAAVDASQNMRVAIVDDASQDKRIQNYLKPIASRPNITVLRNQDNLGFVGAVNRALRTTDEGDVILLNADTLVPVDALARLRAIVTASPDIGTATPLSNNGEFTSFPIANRSNPLLSPHAIEQLDERTGQVNGETVIDIPNGIGFCLYITHKCLDAVGELSDVFHRGYLEDVDFCLRAGEAGFRNVCVPGVYVGHEGSRSFRQEKRSLVVRNLRVLEQRYPRYKAECAAFAMADPLRGSRALLERAMLVDNPRISLRVILVGDGAVRDIASDRARQLSTRGIDALLAVVHPDGQHIWMTFHDPAEDIPHSIQFDVAQQEGREQIQRFLGELAPQYLEIAEPTKLTPELAALIRVMPIPYRVLIADGSLATQTGEKHALRPEWRWFVEAADEVIAVHAGASQFAEQVLGLEVSNDFIKLPSRRKPRKTRRSPKRLGIIVPRTSTEEFQFLYDLGCYLASTESDIDAVILGSTLDDVRLMQMPNLFVTGAIKSENIELLIEGHEIEKLLVGLGQPLFGHPLVVTAEACGLPLAHFDWMPPKVKQKSDLCLARDATTQRSIELIAQWL